jgi:uncharacterized protein YlxP (DUF503 family)
MARAFIGVCTLELELPGMTSLKDKRSVISSLIRKLQTGYHVSAAEIDDLNVINSAVITFAVVSSSGQQANQVISKIMAWIDDHYTDVLITNETIEIL